MVPDSGVAAISVLDEVEHAVPTLGACRTRFVGSGPDTSGYQLAIREQRARARKSGRSVVPWRHAYCKGGVIINEP
jgi:hypothetical protein